MEKRVHPDLRKMFSLMPAQSDSFNEENIYEIRKNLEAMIIEMNKSIPKNDSLLITERFIPGPEGNPDVKVRLYEPKKKDKLLPGVLYLHGGGYIMGSSEIYDNQCQGIISEIECVIISVDFRLAPEHPFPAPLEDCYAALKWFAENSEELSVDSSRIAVVGGSSGGGLTAALSLLARDRKGPSIVFQMPLYPMIDDRIMTPSSNEIIDGRVWNKKSCQKAWKMYLGSNKGEVSPYAAPARATDLSGLPPTYTCVGDLDPFRDETMDYAARLRQAGVPTEFHLYPGCFHGFDGIVPTADISQRARKEYITALKFGLQNN